MKKAIFVASLCTFACIGSATSLHATTRTWDDGGGANNNWSLVTNWGGDIAPTDGDSVSFIPPLQGNSHNDLTAGTDIAGITLASPNWILAGNPIDLSSHLLSSQASGTNTFSIPLVLVSDLLLTVQNNGARLVINNLGTINTNGFELSIEGAGITEINSVISGSGSLSKNGPGFLRLNAANTYNDLTTISGGTVEISNTSGSATGSGAVFVESGAELQGDGNIDGDVNIDTGGEISPGDDEPAILSIGNLSMEPGSVFIVQLYGPVPGTEYSGLDVNGTASINGAIFRIALSQDLQAGDEFVVIDNDGVDDVNGNFANLEEGETFRVIGFDDIGFKITYAGGDGNDVVLTAIPTLSVEDVSVAEPAAGSTTLSFVVRLTEESDETITVKYSTAAGTATAGEDYTATNGTLTFAPGSTQQTVVVTILSDAAAEGDESFFLNLFSPTNASIAKSEGIATITPPGTGGGGGGNGGPGGGGNGSGSGNIPGGSDGGCSFNPAAPSQPFGMGLVILLSLAGVLAWRRRA